MFHLHAFRSWGKRGGLRHAGAWSSQSIRSAQLVRLASSLGEELVGLCYFGDQQSRNSSWKRSIQPESDCQLLRTASPPEDQLFPLFSEVRRACYRGKENVVK
jgi:hypothetical protein